MTDKKKPAKKIGSTTPKKRRGRVAKKAGPKRGPGRPIKYGDNEVPKWCKLCKSTRTIQRGVGRPTGCGKSTVLTRYRRCLDCNHPFSTNENLQS